MTSIPPPASAASAAASPAPALLRRAGWLRALRAVLAMLGLLAGLLLAAWLVLQWAILPRIEQWRPALEQRASAALGVPLRIGALAAESGALRWTPTLLLSDVELQDPTSGEPGLRLPRVRASLSPSSLLPGWDGRWRLRFARLLVEGASLQVARDRDGRLHVAGLPADAGSDDGTAADWLFSQPELAIRDATLTWHDALRDAPPLALQQVELVLRNGVRRHDLELAATPPPDWGGRVTLRGRFTQPLLAARDAADGTDGANRLLARPGDWRRWQGTLHAELPAVDIAPLQRHVELPFDARSGRGALRAWVELDGAGVRAASADVALQDVALRLAPEMEPLAFTRIDGRLTGRWRDDGGELQAERFAFVGADGATWPATEASLRWRSDAQGRLAGGELRTERLDLALLTQTLTRLPPRWVGTALPAALATLAPAGIAQGVVAQWDGSPAAPSRYRIEAKLRGLQLAAQAAPPEPARDGRAPRPVPGRPGVEGLDADLQASEAGGSARLSLQDGVLDVPGVFAEPRVPVTRLDAELDWTVTPASDAGPPRIEVQTRTLRFANADTAGELRARWSTGATADARTPGRLVLDGRLERADATRVARYLPLRLGDDVRDYVGAAVQAGRASAVEFKVDGDLRHFPFDSKVAAEAGVFRVAAQLEGVRLAYLPEALAAPAPAWPVLDEVQGELVFERATMTLRKAQGRLAGVGSGSFAFSGVQGGIANLADNTTLKLEGEGRGALTDALRYVEATPIAGWLDGALAQTVASGGAPATLQLALEIPLFDSDASRVRGRLQLAGNDLRLRPDLPLLAGAKARIAFTERGFALDAGSARLLGGDATFDASLQGDGPLRINVQGTASADGLQRAAEAAALTRGTLPLSGQTGYRLTLAQSGARTEWQLSSNLVGLAIDLPAPLRKGSEQALPLLVQVGAQPAAPSGAAREAWRVELGAEGARLLQAAYLRELGADGSARIVRGGLGVQGAAPQPAAGVAANLKLGRVDLDAWQRVAAAWSAPGAGGAASGAYLPTTLALQAQELLSGERRLTNVVAAVTRVSSGTDSGLWRVKADATELSGTAEYHPSGVRGAEGAGRVVARLARLALPKGDDDAVSALLDQATPARVPALDIVVDDLELRGLRLGRVEIEARNRMLSGGAAGWQLDRLRLVTPEATLAATGEWQAPASPGARRRAVMDFTLDIADGGALLARLGEAGAVRGAKGRLAGRIDWLGSPLQIDYPSLAGQMKVAIERGQFLQAEPGIAKLLGVLSLQSLPRRLLLDFRDVFNEGFAFDSLRGDVVIDQGVATTRNLRMRGVQAVVLMEGRADIARETQDLRVWVVPEINAGSASLAYAVINPAVGIGSFIAQWLLREPIIEAGTREFHVTGAWAAPQVERVERQPGAARPPTDPPSAPPLEPRR